MHHDSVEKSINQYKNVLQSHDDSKLWKMINWSDKINGSTSKVHPTLEDITDHFVLYLLRSITMDEVSTEQMKKGGYDYPISVLYLLRSIPSPFYTFSVLYLLRSIPSPFYTFSVLYLLRSIPSPFYTFSVLYLLRSIPYPFYTLPSPFYTLPSPFYTFSVLYLLRSIPSPFYTFSVLYLLRSIPSPFYTFSVLYLLWSTIAFAIHLLNIMFLNTYPSKLGILSSAVDIILKLLSRKLSIVLSG